MRNWFACAALVLACFTANARNALPDEVAKALREADIPQSAIGIVVQEVGRRSKVLDVNAATPMNPASVMKLVTTWAALETLGPAHAWQTTVFAQGAINNGVLNGDLIIKGSGDPKLTFEQFWLLLRKVRAHGVREIKGDLVLDRSAFAPIEQDGTFDDQPMRPYNVAPDALLLNFKAVRITLIPQTGKTPDLVYEPLLTGIRKVNLIQGSSGPCGDWKEGLRVNQFFKEGRYLLSFSGAYPSACGEQDWHLAVLPHREYISAVFHDLWRELGGTFDGAVRDGAVPEDARQIAIIESPALSEIVRDINKFSNNVMARALFISLDRDAPATLQGAMRTVKQWFESNKIDAPELVLDNGSGLSRSERIAPDTLTRLLQNAAASPLMPEFVASLPLTAVDGTMRKRLKDHDVAGHAHIKTGTLDGVKTMAGYVHDAQGREMIVVFFVNHPNAYRAQDAQDALLSWVHRSSH